ncbi:unnamed protein product [Gadus morhua 'NCC']
MLGDQRSEELSGPKLWLWGPSGPGAPVAFVWLLAVALGHKGRDPGRRGGCPGSQQLVPPNHYPRTTQTTAPPLPHNFPNHNCPRTSQTTSPPPANHRCPNHHQPVPVLVTELSRAA